MIRNVIELLSVVSWLFPLVLLCCITMSGEARMQSIQPMTVSILKCKPYLTYDTWTTHEVTVCCPCIFFACTLYIISGCVNIVCIYLKSSGAC